jgi:hypothetical protein
MEVLATHKSDVKSAALLKSFQSFSIQELNVNIDQYEFQCRHEVEIIKQHIDSKVRIPSHVL